MLESVPGQGRLFVLLKKASSNFRVSIVYLRIDLLELLADYPETGTGANYICFNKYFTAEERHSPQLITPRFFRPVLWKQPVPGHGAAAASAGNPVDLGSSGLTQHQALKHRPATLSHQWQLQFLCSQWLPHIFPSSLPPFWSLWRSRRGLHLLGVAVHASSQANQTELACNCTEVKPRIVHFPPCGTRNTCNSQLPIASASIQTTSSLAHPLKETQKQPSHD